ncbi:hypothetical protein [Polaribacter ponticola]|uniref:Lipoprotein n=1 Tax=Polaribacter ponticola TaxID=2978475 RepID=A0ABT5SAM5_9FLAO|nr:hypothetical protein [Polaribacter sp. MSW5]MDD7915143.1 hypothetical protein [Polaribacter sp. MSW5]
MKLLKITFILTLSLFLFNCKSAYVHNDFNTKTANHTKIAVLPFKIITTGNLPKKISKAETIKIQEEEAVLFQTSLINQLLRKDAQRKSKNLKVEVLSKETTNTILKENGYSISEAVDINPSELAKILKVDAVVSSTVQKQRYMSDLASVGIELGNSILKGLGVNVKNKTNDIIVTSNIINENDGSNLFNISKTFEVDWKSKSIPNIIDDVNKKIIRNFPYLK